MIRKTALTVDFSGIQIEYKVAWQVTHSQDSKGTSLSDVEYLRNGTRYRHSYNEILTGHISLVNGVIGNDVE